MNNIEQALPAQAPAGGQWDVRFSPGRQPQGRWRWSGKGSITIGSGGIGLQGRRHRNFWFSAPQRIELTNAQIRNVTAIGPMVSFEAVVSEGKPEVVRLRATDAHAASALAAALPSACTADFARVRTSGRHSAKRCSSWARGRWSPRSWLQSTSWYTLRPQATAPAG